MVAGSFVMWNIDEHLEGVPLDLRNLVQRSGPVQTWWVLRKDVSVETGAPSCIRASEGTACLVVAADVDANLAAAYGAPRVFRSRSAAMWIPDWYWSETDAFHTATSIAKDGNVECLEHGLACAKAVLEATLEKQTRKRTRCEIRE